MSVGEWKKQTSRKMYKIRVMRCPWGNKQDKFRVKRTTQNNEWDNPGA